MDFQRARNDDQREQRRRHILEITAGMLTEMPVAQLSLNELSRRVGLAKANVLRYFESREAILLQLLDAELQDWLAELEDALTPVEGTPRERGDRLARVLAESLAERPVLCDLISAQAAVLEHNVSAQVAIEHKKASLRTFQALAQLFLRYLPELGGQDVFRLVGLSILAISAAWPYSSPPDALLAAYASSPALAPLQADFTDLVRQSVEVTISGLLARAENVPLGTGPVQEFPDREHRE
ncbi:TetR/AcrR family transcriptional regulator [Streptomyces sp. NPDC018029]|uniref:TetR/AcrR family transcriptional regulator n=1 Tax=Streptomyces sp. NPDC018029 TaxID=3365032 RepID=UPI0037B40D74